MKSNARLDLTCLKHLLSSDQRKLQPHDLAALFPPWLSPDIPEQRPHHPALPLLPRDQHAVQKASHQLCSPRASQAVELFVSVPVPACALVVSERTVQSLACPHPYTQPGRSDVRHNAPTTSPVRPETPAVRPWLLFPPLVLKTNKSVTSLAPRGS